ncbi:mitochondrial PGP phosphatase-domain-containing protein [Zopfochytrium polystomum]|nr:mitochondrial PGP phosphatase-domain-containing protein [Zopfochytrium polystomum]
MVQSGGVGQSLNLQGVLALTTKVLWQPSLAIPKQIVPDMRAIDYRALRRSGHSVIVFDKDNTLTAPYSNSLHPPFREAWAECCSEFGPNVWILSNSAGTPDDKDFAQSCSTSDKGESVRISCAPLFTNCNSQKPGGTEELLQQLNGISPSEIVVVGDRVLTDVVYGNLMGAYTILTRDIITEKGDNWFAAKIRRIERAALSLLGRS